MDLQTGWIKLGPNAAAWSQVDDETVLLDLRSAQYLGVNRSGSVLWNELAVGTRFDDLVAALIDHFGLGQERATDDVQIFLQFCLDHGFITVSAATSD